jgi:ABC-type branched-subunit amino acid transport system substrate-binding protein
MAIFAVALAACGDDDDDDGGLLFLAGDGVRDDEFLAGAGDAAEGAYLSLPSPVLAGEVYDSFAERFQEATGEAASDSPFTAEAFDSATVIIQALQAVAVADGDSLTIDLEALNDAIRSTELDGAIGRIRLNARGDNEGGETPVSLFRVEDGAFVAIEGAAGGAPAEPDDTPVEYGSAGFTTVTIPAGQPIKIGISSILAGDLESLGVPIAQAAEIAGEGVEIEGHAIEFVRRDDQCTPEGGASAATQLIDEGVIAVVGPVCSGSVIAAQPQYEAAGITHVSPSSTAIASTNPARGAVFQTFLRVTFNDAIQGPAQARFALEELDVTKVYVVHDTDAYGSGLRDAFSAAFEEGGGEVVGVEGYEKQATDFQAIVTNILNSDAELVYFAGFFAEATPFLQQLRDSE